MQKKVSVELSGGRTGGCSAEEWTHGSAKRIPAFAMKKEKNVS
jgi:hypothetical protein